MELDLKPLFEDIVVFRTLGIVVVWSSVLSHALIADEIRHSFFIAGPTFTGIIDEEGREAWSAGTPAARDGFVLPNGNVLVAWSADVKEFTRDKSVVFHFPRSNENREIGTVQRLPDGRTLITELGVKPRLLEIDVHGKVAAEIPL